jgi:hypothetical protein
MNSSLAGGRPEVENFGRIRRFRGHDPPLGWHEEFRRMNCKGRPSAFDADPSKLTRLGKRDLLRH